CATWPTIPARATASPCAARRPTGSARASRRAAVSAAPPDSSCTCDEEGPQRRAVPRGTAHEPMTAPLLDVRHLTTVIDTPAGALHPVDDVSFQVPAGSTVALVGESGCGKSMTALSLLRLLPSPPARVAGGSVLFEGADLMALSEREMRQVRGARIAMIFQEPMTSLNPVYTVGAQIVEAIRIHQAVGRRAARARAIELLGTVGIPSPGQRVDAYPHELSGGMRQRVMIAMALSCNPKLLIADEPTTALDVTIQAQILDLLRRLQQTFEMSILFITHDL